MNDDRLKSALRGLGSEHEPPRDWQRGVWERIERRRNRRRLILSFVVFAIAGAPIAWILIRVALGDWSLP